MFEKFQSLQKNPSPNLSPTGGEASKPPFPCREGGEGGVRFPDFFVNKNTFQTTSDSCYKKCQ
jgi:hypothetical protein